jgi:hypothetical protein
MNFPDKLIVTIQRSLIQGGLENSIFNRRHFSTIIKLHIINYIKIWRMYGDINIVHPLINKYKIVDTGENIYRFCSDYSLRLDDLDNFFQTYNYIFIYNFTYNEDNLIINIYWYDINLFKKIYNDLGNNGIIRHSDIINHLNNTELNITYHMRR